MTGMDREVENMNMHHVGMAVQNREIYERSVEFYRNVLGFSVKRRWASPPRHITMLDMGNGILEIVLGAEGTGTGTFAHLAVGVETPDMVDVVLERCRAWGCIVTRPAGTVEAVKYGENGRSFRFRNGFCTGPAGEQLEFFCEF